MRNTAAEALGITLVPTGEPSDQPEGTILSQDVRSARPSRSGARSTSRSRPARTRCRYRRSPTSRTRRRCRRSRRRARGRAGERRVRRPWPGLVARRARSPARSWRRARPSTTSCRRAPNRHPRRPRPRRPRRLRPRRPPRPRRPRRPRPRRPQSRPPPRLGQAPGSSQRLQRGSSGSGPASASIPRIGDLDEFEPRNRRSIDEREAGPGGGHLGRDRGRRVRLPAGADLIALEREPSPIECAVAELAGDRATEVPAGQTGGAGAVTDPAAGGLGLRDPAVRASPHRHVPMVAATSDAVDPAAPSGAPRRASLSRDREGEDVLGGPELVARDQDRRAALAAIGAPGDRGLDTRRGRSGSSCLPR